LETGPLKSPLFESALDTLALSMDCSDMFNRVPEVITAIDTAKFPHHPIQGGRLDITAKDIIDGFAGLHRCHVAFPQ
jgi:hypothetical protein